MKVAGFRGERRQDVRTAAERTFVLDEQRYTITKP
jgi:hypothetical protein